MPLYADQFARAGQTAGGLAGGAAGAGGGGLLSALGSVLEPLDYPRQALWNAVRAGGRAISGEGSMDDLLGAIPGALGAGLAGGLVASGVGAPLGILAGSALGGLAQGIGKRTGSEAFDAPEVSDLTGTDELVPNLIVGALTDPTTYAGGLGGAARGAKTGSKIGREFGQGLETAALQRGPRYAGGAEKVAGVWDEAFSKMGANFGDKDRLDALSANLEAIKANPALLAEIPEGSKFLGQGMQTTAFRRPEGGVVTFAGPQSFADRRISSMMDMPPPRIDIPEMNPTMRSVGIEGELPLRVEHAPGLDVFPHTGVPDGVNPAVWRQGVHGRDNQADKLADELANVGIDFWDAHLGNIGTDPSGINRIIDPGAVAPNLALPKMSGGMSPTNLALPLAQEVTGQPTTIQNLMLRLLGSDQAVQRELAEKLAAGSVTESPIMRELLERTGRVRDDVLSPIGGASSPRIFEGTTAPSRAMQPADDIVAGRLRRFLQSIR